MPLDFIRVLLDTGMLILIWLVQLVIYPGFCYYSETDLILWHKKYTTRLSYIVMPLMIGQLLVTAVQLLNVVTVYTLVSGFVVIALWLSTFIQFVPLHNSIATKTAAKETPQRLVKLNWIRTVLWTFLFIWSIFWYSHV
ncbi:hypothetical protein [Leeuwenhoekiella sp. NPDC079379]|uniref:hypothetical protein n=1 Tax=Leeuwenhoekiella sp. NPDC079379 TaxID=3364122 RepID=UPI0037C5291D